MGIVEATPLTCWTCAADVPTGRYPSPFCSDACQHAFWGPDTDRDCRACGVPPSVCASTRNIIARSRCCDGCNHTAPAPEGAPT